MVGRSGSFRGTSRLHELLGEFRLVEAGVVSEELGNGGGSGSGRSESVKVLAEDDGVLLHDVVHPAFDLQTRLFALRVDQALPAPALAEFDFLALEQAHVAVVLGFAGLLFLDFCGGVALQPLQRIAGFLRIGRERLPLDV